MIRVGGKMKEKIIKYFRDIKQNKVKKITVITFFLAPLVVNLIIETLNKRSFFACLGFLAGKFPTFLINYIIVLFTMSFILLMKKRLAGILALSSVWIGLGIANFIIKSFRETPFSFNDIRLADSVGDIINKYLNAFSLILIIVMIILAVLAIVGLFLKVPKYDDKRNIVRNIIYIIIFFFIMSGTIKLGLSKGWVSEKFPNLTIAYKDYGFSYCFANSVVNVGVKKPDKISSAELEEIVKKVNNTKTVNEDGVQTPNIIFLQLESFFDVNNVKGLELSEEATPIFNSLKKEYPSGFLSVNNVGYGTANTEFEVMTGMNLEDFGPGEFPYKTVLNENTCESMSFILREYGYITHAMHNNTGTFYSRNEVFKNLGFDTFTSVEYMHGMEYTPKKWVKDKILTDEIIQVLDSTEEQDYIYAISVQGHGSYPTSNILDDPKIQVDGLSDEDRMFKFLYYVNEIKEMDDFIGELTEALSEYDEDIILVMYGDHLPSLDISEDELKNGDVYQTEYIIWSNFGFELEDKDIERFELGSRIMKALNIDGCFINKFHQVYGEDENNLEYLSAIEYDILYNNEPIVYGGPSPYIATDMQMGTYEIKISDVIKDQGQFDNIVDDEEIQYSDSEPEDEEDMNNQESLEDDEIEEDDNIEGETLENETEDETDSQEEKYKDYYIVCGEHFTKYSRVYINGEMYNTEYIDETKLRVKISNLNSLDSFVVKQYYKGKILSKSKDFIYIKADIIEPPIEEESSSEE